MKDQNTSKLNWQIIHVTSDCDKIKTFPLVMGRDKSIFKNNTQDFYFSHFKRGPVKTLQKDVSI